MSNPTPEKQGDKPSSTPLVGDVGKAKQALIVDVDARNAPSKTSSLELPGSSSATAKRDIGEHEPSMFAVMVTELTFCFARQRSMGLRAGRKSLTANEMEMLKKRIKILEESSQPSVEVLIAKLNKYSLRKAGDFDKYRAISILEELVSMAQQKNHEKAHYYRVVLESLKECFDKPLQAFRADYQVLVGDPAHGKVMEALAKCSPQKRLKDYHTPHWELDSNFHPEKVPLVQERWVSYDGTPPSAQGVTPHNSHLSDDQITNVISGKAFGNISSLLFRDPSTFLAGALHRNVDAWKHLFSGPSSFPQTIEVLDWLENEVDVFKYFKHFKGKYKGVVYDSDIPPETIFYNHPSCKPFSSFISNTSLDRLASGAISLWGKVNQAKPPHLVLPLTVEPSKPRLCNDDRFLNLSLDCG
ncbi:hypothetical protein OS493_024240 [Desmophyllum pertusum]|uniref:Uncharacterized protein n=1 Tax=Desmophyllum pertusum TaxID=174260 RepID=A0A9W9YY12_9CNID|nr:hypothetical protein OS493_024240 [Desmophyllum pertusum]